MGFLSQTARGPFFLGLNALRVISIVALGLVFAATVVTIADDIKAVNAAKAAPSAAAASPSPSPSQRALEPRRRVTILPPYTPEPEPSAATTLGFKFSGPAGKRAVAVEAQRQPVESGDGWYIYHPEPSAAVNRQTEADGGARVYAAAEEEAEPRPVTVKAPSNPSPSPTPATQAAPAVKNAASPASTAPTAENASPTCDYYTHSTVPSQAGGTFWSVLSRIFILFECALLLLSELNFPRALFDTYVPMLGPSFGSGPLGVLQALIASSVLSHHCALFAQVSAWLLFMVAAANVLVGIFWREKAKERRALSWENAASLTPQTRAASAAWKAGSSVHDSVAEWKARNAAQAYAVPARTAAPTEASAPSFYSQNTPAPTVAPTVVPRTNRFSWDTVRAPMGLWGRREREREPEPELERVSEAPS